MARIPALILLSTFLCLPLWAATEPAADHACAHETRPRDQKVLLTSEEAEIVANQELLELLEILQNMELLQDMEMFQEE